MTALDILSIISSEYKEILMDNLCGIYLHGSLAFGCFNQAKSDIDFLVVVYDDIQQSQKEALIRTLLKLNDIAPPKGFEMSVVLYKDCKTFSYPTPFLLHYSNFHKERAMQNLSDYCLNMTGTDIDLAAHFTVVKKVGVSIIGKPVDEVFADVPAQYYLDSIKSDIQAAESEIVSNPVYIILNLCRVLAYIKEGLVLSKQQGGRWGIDKLPGKYSDLIKNAAQCYSSDGEFEYDTGLLKQFAGYMLDEIYAE